MNKSLVDSAWNCGCGALNAGYLTKCSKCNKEKKL
jgi:hypothetical protein